jgi:pimeloyl-ACP methyl ester carboxylesterase
MPSLVVDGRQVAYEVTGDPSHPLVIAAHGTPGGRLASHPSVPIAVDRAGCCLITFDRPGYGDSDPQPGRTVADVAPIVAALASVVNAETFAVYGISGGAPHALACAALLPGRVTRTASLVGIAPFDALGDDWTTGMTEGNIEEFAAAAAGAEALAAMLTPAVDAIRARPAVLGDFLREDAAPADVAFLDDPAVRDQFVAMTADGVRPGPAGWIDDDLAFVAPWGFDPASIDVPTLIWAGEADTLVPVAHAHSLHRTIRGSALVTVPNGGHLGAFAIQGRVLDWLVNGAPV